MLLILSISEGRMAELTLEPPSSFEHGSPVLGLGHLNKQLTFNSLFLTKTE